MQNYLNTILSAIQKEKCVIIIGPELLDFGNKTFFELMCQELPNLDNHQNVLDDFSEYIFLNEELIQLKPGPQNEKKAATMIDEFYQKQTAFDEPLRKISQMPFKLIISLMPDGRLRKIFDEQNFDHRFGFYPIDKPFDQIVEDPSTQIPLIYNLLGNLDVFEAVITFDSMFRFLANILKYDLPNKVSKTLESASSFIFLGVHFERWHTQLLLKIITAAHGFNYSISKNGSSKDVSVFVSHRLQLELLDNDPVIFLNTLYNRCKELNILKKPALPQSVANVFVSYSHNDQIIALAIAKIFRSQNVKVIIDEDDMPGGQKIANFIAEIEQVGFFIPLISASSLFRPFVIKEIYDAIDRRKTILPCLLDYTLNKSNLHTQQQTFADEELKKIADEMHKNPTTEYPELTAQRYQWIEYKKICSVVVNELKSIKGRQINESDIETTVKEFVRDIKRHQGHAKPKSYK